MPPFPLRSHDASAGAPITVNQVARVSRRTVLASVAAAGLTGCARARAGERLSLWALATQGENAPRLIPAFEAATGLRVDVQALPWTAAHAKMLSAYAGRTLPDVMMVPQAWLAELAMLGAVVPLDSGRAGLLRDLFDAPARGVTIGGRAFGVPWYVDSWAQFYRRDLVAAAGYQAPPPDWSAWRTMAATIKRRSPDKFVVLALLDWPEQLFALAAQQPDPLLRDGDTRGNFRSPGFREALRFYKSLYDDKFAPAVVGTEIGDTLIAFRDGYFAILPSTAPTVGDFRVAGIDRTSWAVNALPGPHGDAGGLASGASLCVTRDARDPARAWALVAYLCAPATQQRLFAITGDLPSRPSAWDAPALAHDRVAAVFRAQLQRSHAAPAVPEWPRIVTEVQAIAEQMVRGGLSVGAAATAMDARVDALLDKRRWLRERGRVA